jgi:hypothetical protein
MALEASAIVASAFIALGAESGAPRMGSSWIEPHPRNSAAAARADGRFMIFR